MPPRQTSTEQPSPIGVETTPELSQPGVEAVENESEVNVPELEQTIQTELADLTQQSAELLASIDTASPEGQTAKAELEAINEEAEAVTASFWQKLGNIIGHPVEAFKGYRQNKREKELAIPDNQKVIDDFLKKTYLLDNNIQKIKDLERKPDSPKKNKERKALERDLDTNLDSLLAEHKKAQKENLGEWRRVEKRIVEILDFRIRDFIEKNKTQEALDLWSKFVPNLYQSELLQLGIALTHHIAYEFKPETTASKPNKTVDDIARRETTKIEFMKARLAEHPDLYGIYALTFTRSYAGTDDTDRYKDVLDTLKKKPEQSWVLNRFEVDHHVPGGAIDGETRERLFDVYCKNNNYDLIIRRPDLFKVGIEKLSAEKRADLFKKITKIEYYNANYFGGILSNIPLSTEEFKILKEGLPTTDQESEKLQKELEKSPLYKVVNGEHFGHTVAEKPAALLEIIDTTSAPDLRSLEPGKALGTIREILSYLQENPEISTQIPEDKISLLVNSIIKDDAADSRVIVLFLSEMKQKDCLSASVLEEAIKTFSARFDPWKMHELFKNNSDLIPTTLAPKLARTWLEKTNSLDLELYIKEKVTTKTPILDDLPMKIILSQYMGKISTSYLTEKFFGFFKTPPVLENTYAQLFIEKLCANTEYSYSYEFGRNLVLAQERGEISASQSDDFFRVFIDSVSDDVLKSLYDRGIITANNPKLMKECLLKLGLSGDIRCLQAYDNGLIELSPDENKELVIAYIKKIQVNSLSLSLEPINRKRYFLTENLDEIVSLLEEHNPNLLAEVLFRPSVLKLSDERRNELIEKKLQTASDDDVCKLLNQIEKQTSYDYDPLPQSVTKRILEHLKTHNFSKATVMLIQVGNLSLKFGLSREQKTTLTVQALEHTADKNFVENTFNYLKNDVLQFDDVQKKLLFSKIIELKIPEPTVDLIFGRGDTYGIKMEKEVETQAIHVVSEGTDFDAIFRLLKYYMREKGKPLEESARVRCIEASLALGGFNSIYRNYIESTRMADNPFLLTPEQCEQEFDKLIKKNELSKVSQLFYNLVNMDPAIQESVHRPNAEQGKAMMKIMLTTRESDDMYCAFLYNPSIFKSEFNDYCASNPDEIPKITYACLEKDELMSNPEIIHHYDQTLATTDLEVLKTIADKNPSLFLKRIEVTIEKNKQQNQSEKNFKLYNNCLKIGHFPPKYSSEIFVELEKSEVSAREKQLCSAAMFEAMIKGGDYTFLDTQRPGASKEVEDFLEQNAIGNKGLTILTLLAAREYSDQEPIGTIVENILNKLQEYNKVLQRHQSEFIPAGLGGSIGMEYEITDSTAKGYNEQTSGDLKKDIRYLSTKAGIGQGNDAVHEIATKPSDNPYAILLEMKLIQDLGFIDFNFQGQNYESGSRGYHLTIGGEHGLPANANTNFLQNSLVLSGWGGVNAGREVSGLSRARGCNIRERGSGNGNIKVFENQTPSVEFRSLSIDRWEPFERTVLTSHYGSIGIQAMEKYTTVNHEFLQTLTEDFPATPEDFLKKLTTENKIKGDIPPEPKIAKIMYEWAKLVVETVRSIDDHNANFLMNETAGYMDDKDNWVEPSDWGGAENESRFQSVVKSLDPGLDVQTYTSKLTISREACFRQASAEMVNAATAINNLFLKPSATYGGDGVNALAMLEVTKLGNGRLENSPAQALNNSVFDEPDKRRQGYYSVQGGSERMITHALQRHLLHFVKKMEELLAAPLAVEKEKTKAKPKKEIKLAA